MHQRQPLPDHPPLMRGGNPTEMRSASRQRDTWAKMTRGLPKSLIKTWIFPEQTDMGCLSGTKDELLPLP
jgi:hypothetical protein